MEGAAAQVAEGDAGMASVLLRRLAERTAARERLRADEDEDEREWTRHGDAYFIRFPEGHLCKLRHRGRWTLVLVWPDRRMRVLIRGSRKSIERYAQEVLCHGPPGGPDYEGGELEWRANDDDATLRAATIGGELRLMPWHDGQCLLLLVQNDYGAAVLGRGRREVLLRTAEDLLDERGADTLHLRLGDVRINLHGLGSASTVGYVDLQHGGQFVLGPAGDGDFALLYQLGEYTREIGIYTLAQVRRGDLGRAFAWSTDPGVAEPPRQEVEIPRPSDVAPVVQPEVARATRSHEVATPSPELTRATSEVAKATPPREVAEPSGATSTSTGGPPLLSGSTAATFPQERSPCLSARDLRLVERHLTLDEAPTGGGASLVPRLLHGLYRLIASGLDDLLLRAVALRSLLAKQFGIDFDCCARTFRRALLAVAAHTQLLRKVGHRWHLGIGALQRQDSALLCWIRAVTPPDTDEAEGVCRETDPKTDRGAGPAPEVPVERRADPGAPMAIADRAAPPGVRESVERTGSHERRGPSAHDAPSDHDRRLQAPEVRVDEPEVGTAREPADHTAVRRPDPPATTDRIADHERVPTPRSGALADHANLHPRQEDPEPDRRAYAAAAVPDVESPPPRWGYQRRLRTDGKPTVWQRKRAPLPADQCPSQFSGKKGRGPPRGE